MVSGRPRSFTVKLSEEEHEVLNSYARSRSLPHALARRANIGLRWVSFQCKSTVYDLGPTQPFFSMMKWNRASTSRREMASSGRVSRSPRNRHMWLRNGTLVPDCLLSPAAMWPSKACGNLRT